MAPVNTELPGGLRTVGCCGLSWGPRGKWLVREAGTCAATAHCPLPGSWPWMPLLPLPRGRPPPWLIGSWSQFCGLLGDRKGKDPCQIGADSQPAWTPWEGHVVASRKMSEAWEALEMPSCLSPAAKDVSRSRTECPLQDHHNLLCKTPSGSIPRGWVCRQALQASIWIQAQPG